MPESNDDQLLRELLRQEEEGKKPASDARHVSKDKDHKVDPLPSGSQSIHPEPQGHGFLLGSKRILQMEFNNVQLSCLSSVSMCGVLVCLERGMLHEFFSEEAHIRTMTLQLHQVRQLVISEKLMGS